jgi:hypothetical protein
MGYSSSLLIPVPAQVLRLVGSCLGQSAAIERLTESLEVSALKAHQLLAWNPLLDVEQAIQITVDDFLSSRKVS